jgi:wobble nucleotide-excising tRNase
MLQRFSVVKHLGRLTVLHHGKDDDLRFRRLTLLYARNASGKTTLARLLAAAGSQDAAAVEAHRTLDAPTPPEVVLSLRDGTCRFDGAEWKGTTPRVVVFDRDFIEANVAVGQSPDKATRKGLLELALGADAVASKHALDGFARLGGEIARELAPHAATIRTAAQAAALPEVQFIALPSVEDPVQERQAAEAIERDAISAAEVVKRPRPAPLPVLVSPDLDAVAGLLGRTARRLGDEAERQVLDHLEGRLGGQGERWVRGGLSLDDGQTCPFCGQDTRDLDLIRHYRSLFDPAWDQLAASVEAMGRSFDGLESWWSQVAQVGQANRTAFEA